MRLRARAGSHQGLEVGPPLSRFLRIIPIVLILLVYFLAGKVSLKFAFVNPSATPVWLPTGVALAAFLLLGYRIWPGILIGAFLVNLTTAGSIATSFGLAVGNTLEGLTGAYLANRFACGCKAFYGVQNIFRYALVAGIISTMVSATLGVTSLCLGGFASWPSYGAIWFTWWLGDGVSTLVVAPLLVLWGNTKRLRCTRAQIIEAAVLFPLLAVVGQIAFGGLLTFRYSNLPLEFLCIPLLIWASFRFGAQGAASAIFVIYAVAIRGTLHGLGPFVVGSPNDSVLLLDLFVAVLAVMGLALAAATSERKRAAERFSRVVEAAPNAIVAADQAGKIVLVNRQAEKMFGYQREELVGRSLEVLVPERFRHAHPGHRSGFSAKPTARPMGAGRDLYAVRKDGSEFPVEIGLNPIDTEPGTLILSAIVDITERKRAEEEILHLASTDSLTGLANHRRLLEVFKLEVERSGRTGRSFSLLLLDLDGLKKINDAHGHLVGSRALCRLALVLQQNCRLNDTPARHGGDQFSVVLPETDLEGARNLAWRMAERLAADPERPPIAFSFGVATFPQDGSTFDEVVGKADRFLYEMKRARARGMGVVQ
jgi:diguanylate cyclase (GGDEF)-like protein/PAS domain S-box-containing protein